MAQPKAPRSRAPAPGRPSVQVQAVATSESFEGPFPHPAILQQYNAIVPDAAERILRMAEDEAAHRHEQERLALQANISAQQRQLALGEKQTLANFRSDMVGQALGGVVSVLSVGGAVYLAMVGQPWVAGALVGLPLAGVVRALRDRPAQQGNDVTSDASAPPKE